MPSLLRRSGEHAPRPSDSSSDTPTRAARARGAARAAVLVAVLAGTTAFAGHAAGPGAGTPAIEDTLAALAAPGDDARGLFGESSRSQERSPLDGGASIAVDGGRLAAPGGAETVAEALALALVDLGPEDVVTPALDAPVPAGGTITVSRVTYEERTERTETPYEVTEQPDGALAVGQRVVVSAGAPGIESVLYRVRLIDGVEAGREEIIRTGTPAVAEVVRVGSDPKSIARAQVAARGWGSEQFACLDRLWTKESNWNPLAQNSSSGAYGIPQSLPGSKMATVAADWRTNPATQITWGLNYIAGRYGTPCAAWSHSQAVNWY